MMKRWKQIVFIGLLALSLTTLGGCTHNRLRDDTTLTDDSTDDIVNDGDFADDAADTSDDVEGLGDDADTTDNTGAENSTDSTGTTNSSDGTGTGNDNTVQDESTGAGADMEDAAENVKDAVEDTVDTSRNSAGDAAND